MRMKRCLTLYGSLFSLIACSSQAAPTADSLSPDASIFPRPGPQTTDELGENPWLHGFGGAAEEGELQSSGSTSAADPTDPSDPTPPPSKHDTTSPETGSKPDQNTPVDPLDPPEMPDRTPALKLEEYLEGKGSDKVLSFSNTGAGTEGSCHVEVYVNGGTTPWRSMPLSPLPNPGETGSYCSAVVTGRDCLGEISGNTFNGNDALLVRCNEQLTDSFGQVGYDPGPGWSSVTSAQRSTKDSHWLRCSSPDLNASDPFLIDEQWILYPEAESLSAAQAQCPGSSPLGLGGTTAL